MNDSFSRATQSALIQASPGQFLHMGSVHSPSTPVALPHHRLIAYSVSLELLAAVRAASLRDARLRDEALRSAKSACLNTAEGAGRVTRAPR